MEFLITLLMLSKYMSSVLAVTGKVLPVTLDDMKLSC